MLAAKQGYKIAQPNLGLSYQQGRGVIDWPCSYMALKLDCAFALPCSAATLYHFTSSAISTFTPRPCEYMTAKWPQDAYALLPACTTSQLQLYPPTHVHAHMKIPKSIALLHNPVLLPARTPSQSHPPAPSNLSSWNADASKKKSKEIT